MFVSSPVLSLPLSSLLANVPSEKVECKNGELAGSSSFLMDVLYVCLLILNIDKILRFGEILELFNL